MYTYDYIETIFDNMQSRILWPRIIRTVVQMMPIAILYAWWHSRNTITRQLRSWWISLSMPVHDENRYSYFICGLLSQNAMSPTQPQNTGNRD